MNEIVVPHGVRKCISESLGVSYPTIKLALRGQSKSDIGKKIRKAALNQGGYEIVKK